MSTPACAPTARQLLWLLFLLLFQFFSISASFHFISVSVSFLAFNLACLLSCWWAKTPPAAAAHCSVGEMMKKKRTTTTANFAETFSSSRVSVQFSSVLMFSSVISSCSSEQFCVRVHMAPPPAPANILVLVLPPKSVCV